MKKLKKLNKKNLIIILFTTIVVLGCTFFMYKTNINNKVNHYTAEISLFSNKINNLILNEAKDTITKLINEYKTELENKNFKKLDSLLIDINKNIDTISKTNSEDIDKKINELNNLDKSKLEDSYIETINIKITEITNLKLKNEFNKAITELNTLIDTVTKDINSIIEEEKKIEEERKIAEAKKLAEEKKKQETVSDDNSLEALIAKSPTARLTNQIVGVVGSGSSAKVYLFEKEGDSWKTTLQTSGYVGQGGIGQASETSTRTPKGSYSLGFAFGTGPNPGALLPYRQITENSYWISDVNNPLYNTWQEGNYAGNNNEHLIEYSVQYKYAITLNYNNGVGGGSAFFLHCSNGMPTLGCISVQTNTMLALMQKIKPGAYIINVNSTSELSIY